MLKVKNWLEKGSIIISSVMTAAMMIILLCNVILRYVPGIGGFKWYMESSQYLNVWAMLIIGIQICVTGGHLKVEIADSLFGKTATGKKVIKVIHSIFIILFYVSYSYSGYLLATKAKQAVSTMPKFKMGQVYWMIPIASIICILATTMDMVITVAGKEEKGGENK